MIRIRILALTLAAACATPAFAADEGRATSAAFAPSSASAQFDFLLGEWTLDAQPQVGGLVRLIHGTPHLAGTWKAERSADGTGINDEFTLTDTSGNPIVDDRTHRLYDAAAKRWKIGEQDDVRKRSAEGAAEWGDGEMHQSGRATYTTGDSFLVRSRFYAITAAGFRVQQDRSMDDGKTWEENVLTIQATRASASTQ